MAFTSCHDRGSNRLPPDGRASTLTTQPLRLAVLDILATYIGQAAGGQAEKCTQQHSVPCWLAKRKTHKQTEYDIWNLGHFFLAKMIPNL